MSHGKIKELTQRFGFDDARYLMVWHGWEVYVPCYSDPKKVGPDIGSPFNILVKGEEMRTATFREWMQIFKKAEEQGLVRD